MVNRPAGAAEPDDTSHVRALEADGAVTYRGEAGSRARGVVTVGHDGTEHELRARNVVVAVGSTSKLPPIEGLAATSPWTNREATLTRELPRSLLVLGGGPTGCELAQVYARFGVPVTIVQSGPRLVPDRASPQRRGDPVRAGARRGHRADGRAGRSARGPAQGPDGAHVIDLDDGSVGRGPRDPARGGPRRSRSARLGLEHYGVVGVGTGRLPARRLAAARRRPVGRRRPRGPRAPHPPGPLPGRAGRPDGARRGGAPRLPGAAPRHVHGPRGVVGRVSRWSRPARRGSTRSNASPPSRRRPRATRSRRRPAT